MQHYKKLGFIVLIGLILGAIFYFGAKTQNFKSIDILSSQTPTSAEISTSTPIPISTPTSESATPDKSQENNNTSSQKQTNDSGKATIQNEYKFYTTEDIDNIVKEKAIKLTDPLIQGLMDSMHKLEQEYTPQNLSEAAKYRNIGGQYLYDKENLAQKGFTDWNKVTPNAINYIKEHPFIPVICAMTPDFIQLTAIVQPIGNEYQDYYGVMNETRNSTNEVEFLKGLSDLGYYAVDIYVDDTLNLYRRLPCNGIKLYNGYSVNLDEVYDNLNQLPDDDILQSYLKKYNRQVNLDTELQNKQWNLFLFEKRDNQPAIIEMHIRTYSTKGGVGLRQKIWYGGQQAIN